MDDVLGLSTIHYKGQGVQILSDSLPENSFFADLIRHFTVLPALVQEVPALLLMHRKGFVPVQRRLLQYQR